MDESQISPPSGLLEFQERFSEAIRTPIAFQTGTFVFNIEKYNPHVSKIILPRKDQGSRLRLQIYNEQYWYRLFTVLQQDFPLLAESMGFWKFNQLAGAYLIRYPSRSPFLEKLPFYFSAFLKEESHNLTAMQLQIIQFESALLQNFHAKPLEQFQPDSVLQEDSEAASETKMAFQSGFTLFEEDWNLVEWREYLQQGTLPKMDPISKQGYWAIFRHGGGPEWKAVEALAYPLLGAMVQGMSIGEACESVAETLTEAEMAIFSQSLPIWFRDWTAWGFFSS